MNNEFDNPIETLFIDGYYIEVEYLIEDWCATYRSKGFSIFMSDKDKQTAVRLLVEYLNQELS